MVMMGALWIALVVLSLLFLARGYVSGGSARSLGRLKPRRLESQAKDDPPKRKKAAAKRKSAPKKKAAAKRKPVVKESVQTATESSSAPTRTLDESSSAPSRTLDAVILEKVKEIEKANGLNIENDSAPAPVVVKDEVVAGGGKWSPIKNSASSTGFRDVDEEEDAFMDPFFKPPPPGMPGSDFFGGGGIGSSEKAGWDDWSEDANYFDDDEDDEPDYSGYSKDKSRGREVGKVGKGSSNLFPTRDDYAKFSGAETSSASSSSSSSTSVEKKEPEPAPVDAPSHKPSTNTGIDLPPPNLDVEVIPPESFQSLVKLEERVDSLQNDLLELKIVNAGLLGVLAITIYALTRPIW